MKNSDKYSNKAEVYFDLSILKENFANYHKRYIQRNIRYKFIKKVEAKYEEIEKFRNKWCFPHEYFKNGKDCRLWWNNLPQAIKKRKRRIIHFEEEHILHIKNFEEFSMASSPTERGKRYKINDGYSLRRLFIREIEELMIECQIDPFWYYPFEHYVLYNEINMNFMFNPGFTILIKKAIGSGDKLLSEHIGILFSANTRLKDIKDFAFPLIKHYQKEMFGYEDNSDNITRNDEIDEQLGPDHFPKLANKTWLVSTGYVRFRKEQNLKKSKRKKQ